MRERGLRSNRHRLDRLQGAEAEKAVPYLALRRTIRIETNDEAAPHGRPTTDCFSTRATGLSPSAQLLGLCLLSTLEIIVRLHEKKPSTLAIADRTCLLQVLFRLVPQDIDAHAAIPRYRGRRI
jgi:hypothetical protein